MKSRNISILGVCAALLLMFAVSSCSDDFLEIKNETAAEFDDFWSTPSDAQEGLNSAYDVLTSGAFMGGNVQLLAEIMADNYAANPLTNNGDWAAHYTRTTDIFLGTTRGMIHDGYKVIARANYLMDNLDAIEGLSDEEARRMVAEAKFLRALSHFELVRMFAQPYGYTDDNTHLGIPIRLRYSKEIIDRSTVAEVYAQILQDFNEALPDLPDQVANGYATRDAALGYLAKVHFQMNEFDRAYDYANQVISSGRYAVDTSLTGRFSTQVTSEAVFYLASSFVDNAGGGMFFTYRVDPNSGLAAIALDPGFASILQQNDDRRGQTWVEQIDDFFWISGKIEDTLTQNFTQVPLVHLTELKLIRAESAAEQETDLETAVMDLNDILNPAGLPELATSATAGTIITTARAERRKELVIEGNRFHELKRIAVLEDPDLTIRGAPWDCAGMVCQFPDNELQGNPDFIPNPEGGCN
jgi:tetratricopeptide (TPR) repeat protein